MDLDSHTLSDAGKEVRYLLQHPGRVLSRDLLLGDVWGCSYTGGTRTVDVHVRRLREKLPLLVDALVTVKQFGYKLEEQ
jgi:DNA-binding response OmpR family regulator